MTQSPSDTAFSTPDMPHGPRLPRPVLSVLTPGGDADLLAVTYESLRVQTDPRWEWCVAVPRADLPVGLPLDPRIVTCGGGQDADHGGAALLAVCCATAAGDHLVRVTAGDELAEDAVQVVARTAAPDGWGYTDEEQRFPGGRKPDVWEKPDHSPELLRSQPYAARSAVLSRHAVVAAGGVDADAGSAAWFDLVLKVSERAEVPWHHARPTYVRRDASSSTRFIEGDPDAHEQVLRQHCRRTGIEVQDVLPVVVQGRPVGMHLVRDLPRWPTVSIVVPTRGSSAVVDGVERVHVVELVRSILAARTYLGRQLVVVADAETPASVLTAVRELAGDELVVLDFDDVFNFSRKCNVGAVHASGEYLCFLNDDTEVVSPDWLHEMVGHLEDEGVGAVGAQLLFEDGSFQHIGHHYVAGNAGHPLFGWRHSTLALGAAAHVAGERSGVTAACVLVRHEDFDAVGGFSGLYPLNYNDVDLCLKIRDRGQRIVYTPHARLRHFESQTRVAQLLPVETDQLRQRWSHRMVQDPFLPHTRPTKLRTKFLPAEPADQQPGRGVPVPAALVVITEDTHD